MQPYVAASYLNLPHQNIQNFPKQYYPPNFPRLPQINPKYHPENVFPFPQSIPP
ncbi:BBE domain-containing protein, partial [Bacillus subtilis]|uniref:BBE domain-containing protein n=1 Tax=Bacillus subtilis TaxID=1423 RepID=UPI002078E359